MNYRCVRELKQGLTIQEWEDLKTLSRMQPIGDDRRDMGIIRLGVALLLGWGMKESAIAEAVKVLNPVQEPEEDSPLLDFERIKNFAARHNANFTDAGSFAT